MSQHPTPLTPNLEEYFAANQRAIEALAAAEQAQARAVGDIPKGFFLRHVVQANDSCSPYPDLAARGSEQSLLMPRDLIGLTLFAGVDDDAIELRQPSTNGKNEIWVAPSIPTPGERRKLIRQSSRVFAVGLGGAAVARASWVSREKAYEELLASPGSVLDPRVAHRLAVAVADLAIMRDR